MVVDVGELVYRTLSLFNLSERYCTSTSTGTRVAHASYVEFRLNERIGTGGNLKPLPIK